MNGYNIYHRQDGRYEGRVSQGKKKNGKRLFKYFFGSSREEVKRKIDVSRKQDAADCSQTIGQLFNEWHTSIKHRVKESTAANYLMKAEKHVLPAFSEIIADDLKQADVYSFIDSKLKDGLSNRYVSDIIIMLKSIFKFAVKNYRIFNPLDGITLPKSSKPNIELLDDTQQEKLQKYIAENPSNTTLGIALLMSTGIRIGELCALQWEDIDLKKRILTVRKTMQRIQTPHETTKTKLIIAEPKSESSKREIPIPECVVNLLDKFKGKAKEYLISGSNKATEPRTLQYRFTSILNNVKLPSIHFHALRHMFATNCVKLGFDIKSLSEILGHSSVEITIPVPNSNTKPTQYLPTIILISKRRSSCLYARNLLHFFSKTLFNLLLLSLLSFLALFLSILYGNVRLYYDYTNLKNEPIPETDEKLY